MAGPVFAPGDSGYDDARRVWNADVVRRPALIARCASSGDVVAAVGLARDGGLDVAIRSGAHSTPGLATTDGVGEHQMRESEGHSERSCWPGSGCGCRRGWCEGAGQTR